jgi:hypothetical protein
MTDTNQSSDILPLLYTNVTADFAKKNVLHDLT